MPYVGEARFRFKGAQEDCAPYIRVARVLVEEVRAMFDVGGSTRAATHTKTLPGGVLVRVTVFDDVPPIITIEVPAGGGGKSTQDAKVISFVGTLSDDGLLTSVGKWINTQPQYGYVPDSDPLRVDSVTYNKFSTRKKGDFPCGNMTWFKVNPLTDKTTAVVSWVGSARRCFSYTGGSQALPATDTRIWVSLADPESSEKLFTVPNRVLAAFYDAQGFAYIGRTSAGAPWRIAMFRPDDTEPTGWAEQWAITFPSEYAGYKSHVMVNRTGTEGRILFLKLLDNTYFWLDAESNKFSAETGVWAHDEIVINLTNGTWATDWQDETEHCYKETELTDEFEDSKGPSGYKRFRLKESVTEGVTTTFDVGYYAGTSILASPERKQMPLVGENYTIGSSEFTITDVALIDRLDETLQDLTYWPDINALAALDREQVILPYALDTPPFRAANCAKGATITVSWVSVGGSSSHAVDTSVSIVGTAESQFRWFRKQVARARGKLICAVDYDFYTDEVVKAFLEPDGIEVWWSGVSTWPGGADFKTYDIPLPESGRYDVPAYDYTFPDYPADGPYALPHNGFIGARRYMRNEMNIAIVGGRADGVRVPVATHFTKLRDHRASYGHNGGFADSWTSFDREVYLLEGYHPELASEFQEPSYDQQFEQQKETRNVATIAYVDLRHLTVMASVTSTPVIQENEATDSSIGLLFVDEPENISQMTGSGPPDFTGFNQCTMASSSTTGSTSVVDWYVYVKDAWTFRHGVNGLMTGQPAVEEVNAVVQDDFTRRDSHYAVAGEKAAPADWVTASGQVFTTFALAAQSHTKTWRTYTPMPLYNIGIAEGGYLGAAAVDYRGTTLASLRSDFYGEASVGIGGITSAVNLLFVDPDDLLVVWSPEAATKDDEVGLPVEVVAAGYNTGTEVWEAVLYTPGVDDVTGEPKDIRACQVLYGDKSLRYRLEETTDE